MRSHGDRQRRARAKFGNAGKGRPGVCSTAGGGQKNGKCRKTNNIKSSSLNAGKKRTSPTNSGNLKRTGRPCKDESKSINRRTPDAGQEREIGTSIGAKHEEEDWLELGSNYLRAKLRWKKMP